MMLPVRWTGRARGAFDDFAALIRVEHICGDVDFNNGHMDLLLVAAGLRKQ
jgi:hypothetical protein